MADQESRNAKAAELEERAVKVATTETYDSKTALDYAKAAHYLVMAAYVLREEPYRQGSNDG